MDQKLAARKYAAEASSANLQCRVGRHKLPDWAELDPDKDIQYVPGKGKTAKRKAVPGCYQLVLACQRECGYETTSTIIKVNGQLGRHATPKYDPDYLFESDGRPMGKEALGILRAELIRRVLGKDL